MMTTLELAGHVAYLDLETGDGLLVCPPASEDVWLGGSSVYGAQWADALATLDRHGWEPSEGDDGGACVEGVSARGGEVIGLYGRERLRSEPTIEESARAFEELRTAALA